MASLRSRWNNWQPLPGRGPLVIAHRGASLHETENTVAAFAMAMADGADGVELDVQCCASGEVVVFHDDDLQRLAGRAERIDQLSLGAIRKVRLAGGATMATLDEALEACGSGLINVELKCSAIFAAAAARLVAGVARVLARAGKGQQVLISSFSPGAVWQWRTRHPEVPCALLFERPKPFHRPWPLRTDVLLPLLRPFAVHPVDELCTPRSVARWQRRGYAVHVWTVDEPQRITGLAAMGVNGIVTNDPARACSLLTLTRRSAGG